MTWLVSYRSVSGETVTSSHDTREGALDALTNQLIDAALHLWVIGEDYRKRPYGPAQKRSQEFFDRGDRFIHHVTRLLDTTSGDYLIHGKQGRKWVLCEVPASVVTSS